MTTFKIQAARALLNGMKRPLIPRSSGPMCKVSSIASAATPNTSLRRANAINCAPFCVSGRRTSSTRPDVSRYDLAPGADAEQPPPSHLNHDEDATTGSPVGALIVLAGLILGDCRVACLSEPANSASGGRSRPSSSARCQSIVTTQHAHAPQPVIRRLTWHIVTAGPSPIDPNVWVARLSSAPRAATAPTFSGSTANVAGNQQQSIHR